jgi:anti-sigma B factor antagonist
VDLNLTRRTEGNAVVVTASGELDIYTADALRNLVIEITDKGPRAIVLDLDGVTFLDTTGLAVVVGIMRRAGACGSKLIVVCTRERILRSFRTAGVLEVLDVRDTLAEALKDEDHD